MWSWVDGQFNLQERIWSYCLWKNKIHGPKLTSRQKKLGFWKNSIWSAFLTIFTSRILQILFLVLLVWYFSIFGPKSHFIYNLSSKSHWKNPKKRKVVDCSYFDKSKTPILVSINFFGWEKFYLCILTLNIARINRSWIANGFSF